MWKKKKLLKARKILLSKIYMLIFIIAAFFTGLFTLQTIAYANLEICKQGWLRAFYNSQGPVGYVLENFDRK